MTGSGAGGASGQNGNNSECISSWLELESDPGLFTLLVDDFGVKGVQVEEIYDLTKPLDNSIFGFIFLFKWIERARGRRNKSSNLEPNSNYVTDSNIVNKMFFAHQIVPNSCATHALLSVLLNSKSNKYFDLGDLLDKFKKLCDGLAPETKGLAIGNQPRLAQAHNSYAKPDSNRPNYINNKNYINSHATSSSFASSSSSSSTPSLSSTNLISNNFTSNSSLLASNSQLNVQVSNGEIFHFICFVPINGRLYELDGLKPYPVDHGPIQNSNSNYNNQLIEQYLSNETLINTICLNQLLTNLSTNYLSSIDASYFNWTNKFKQIILQRLSSFNNGQQNHEIRFNLMAVVPDRMCIIQDQIDLMNENRQIILKLIQDVNIENDSLSTSSDSPTNQMDTNENEIKTNQRQLRSSQRASSSNLKKLQSQQSIQNMYDILFSLNRNDLVNDLVKNLKNSSKINFTKFKQDLIKLIDKYDLNEICKLFKIEKITIQCATDDEINSETNLILKRLISLNDLKILDAKLSSEIELDQTKLNEEVDKRKRYKTEALRRKHLYDEFIITYLKILSENGKLEEIIKNSLVNKLNNSNVSNSIQNGQSNLSSSFYISPNTLFLQQSTSKKHRKK